jgi:nucleoside diphosphate kinase
VLVAPSLDRAKSALRLWADRSAQDGGMVETAADVEQGLAVEKTLVLLKPDNFRFRSSRPGNIIDLLSLSGLRIVAVNKFAMTVAQAEEFYGPVRETIQAKFANAGMSRAAEALSREFGFQVPTDCIEAVCERLGPIYAQTQFENIVRFMTGCRPSECSAEEKTTRGSESCLALVYEGVDAVRKIRNLIGPTDPSKASPGSVRREYGSDIMVNAAHASDCRENALREIAIVRVDEDTIRPWVRKCYGE